MEEEDYISEREKRLSDEDSKITKVFVAGIATIMIGLLYLGLYFSRNSAISDGSSYRRFAATMPATMDERGKIGELEMIGR